MVQSPLRTAVLIALAASLTYVTILIWLPFVNPIGWAAAFAIVLAPVNRRLSRLIRSPGLRAGAMTAAVILLIVVPLTLLGIAVAAAVVRMYDSAQQWMSHGQITSIQHFLYTPWVQHLRLQLSQLVDTAQLDIHSMISSALKQMAQSTVTQATAIAQNFYQFIFSFFLMVFTLYIFFRDGRRITDWLTGLLPLPAAQRQRIVEEFSEVVTATIVGDLVVALLQGFMGGLAFWVLGLPASAFWGGVMAFLSILPVVGSPLIYVPAAALVILQGEFVTGALLLAWGGLVVSQIDNILRPVLISGRTKLHTLTLFFSILGGIYLFGLFGIIAGPLVAALFLTMLNLYREALYSEDTGGTVARRAVDDAGEDQDAPPM